MGKFDVGSRVMVKSNGKKYRGKVTEALPKKRRVVTDCGKRMEVSLRNLKQSPDRVLILETQMDRKIESKRVYGPMLQQWLGAYGVQAICERIHTLEDLRLFLKREGSNPATRYIHIMGHGSDERGVGNAIFYMTFAKLDLLENLDIFEGLDGKVLILSCCLVGNDRTVMERIKKVSGAAAVIAYRTEVKDHYTNLCEALLYDRLITTNYSPRKVVDMVGQALNDLGVKVDDCLVRKPVLVCV
jgi:hypothetical protein